VLRTFYTSPLRDELIGSYQDPFQLAPRWGRGNWKLSDPQLSSNETESGCRSRSQRLGFSERFPEQLGNCGDRETPDPPFLATRGVVGWKERH
jgi:hypothetical protein